MTKMNYTRREFVRTVAVTGTATFLSGGISLASPPVRAAGPFSLVDLGKSGIKTTLLGMGTGFNGYNRTSSITRQGKEYAISIIKYAYEKGIRFFDCADSYGTHEVTREALKDYPRESYTIGTKIWVSKGGIPETERYDADVILDRFRKELKTDYLDLVQIHCMTTPDWTDQYKRHLDMLEKLKDKKVLHAHGVSVHSLDAMVKANNRWTDVIHVRINPYGQSMDKPDPNEVTPVIQKLHDAGKGVIGMKVVGAGKFGNDSSKIDESLKYVLGLGTVDMIIVGFERKEQIDDYAERMKRVLSQQV